MKEQAPGVSGKTLAAGRSAHRLSNETREVRWKPHPGDNHRSCVRKPWRRLPATRFLDGQSVSLEAVQRMLDGKQPKKVIVVADRIVNVVV